MSGINATLENLPQAIDKVKRDFIDEFVKRVQQKTPVLTGRLRDGWEGDVNQMSVSNNVEYAEFVEFGTERTPPVAMLRTTIEESEQIFNKVIK
jgi:hypothetical protein